MSLSGGAVLIAVDSCRLGDTFVVVDVAVAAAADSSAFFSAVVAEIVAVVVALVAVVAGLGAVATLVAGVAALLAVVAA